MGRLVTLPWSWTRPWGASWLRPQRPGGTQGPVWSRDMSKVLSPVLFSAHRGGCGPFLRSPALSLGLGPESWQLRGRRLLGSWSCLYPQGLRGQAYRKWQLDPHPSPLDLRLGTSDQRLPHPQKLERARCLEVPASFPPARAEGALGCRVEKWELSSPVDGTRQAPPPTKGLLRNSPRITEPMPGGYSKTGVSRFTISMATIVHPS